MLGMGLRIPSMDQEERLSVVPIAGTYHIELESGLGSLVAEDGSHLDIEHPAPPKDLLKEDGSGHLENEDGSGILQGE
jgi:hypothetical protein